MLKRVFEKYLGQLLILVTVVGAVLFAYKHWRDSQEERKFTNLIGVKEKYEQLTEYTAKLEIRYQSQEELHKKASKEWEELKKDQNERIKALSDATFLISKHVNKQNGPDYYFETPKKTRNYVLNELRIAGENSPPIGYILIKSDGRVYKRTYKFEILVKHIQTIDESTGRAKLLSKAFLIQKEGSALSKRLKSSENWKERPFPLSISGGVTYFDPTQPNTPKKFHFWAPHINGGISFGADIGGFFARPSLDFSIAGWGRSRNDLDFKFLHLGIDSNTKVTDVGLHIIPLSYRFWDSVFTNTYIGPAIGWAKNGINYQLNLNLGF